MTAIEVGTIDLAPVRDASAWRAADVEADRSREVPLDDADRAEIAAALDGVRRAGLALAAITADRFPLPGLAARLAVTARSGWPATRDRSGPDAPDRRSTSRGRAGSPAVGVRYCWSDVSNVAVSSPKASWSPGRRT